MTIDNRRSLISALNKTCCRLSYYGEGSLANLNLLKLAYKYSCYSTTYATLQRIDSIVAELQRTDPDIPFQTTDTQLYIDGAITPVEVLIGTDVNAPVAVGGTVTVTPQTYTFVLADFATGFTDADGDSPALITIKTLPANGTLAYDGVAVTAPYSFLDPSLLVYTRDSDVAYGTSFNYSITDSNGQIPMESNTVSMTVTVEDIVTVPGNEPAVIGDRAQYSGNRVVTVMSVADFTTQTIAPYFDPEANDLDAIRIDEISTANTGVYYYLGSPVATGQIITNAELSVGAFYHEGPDSNSITTDSFNASVRDTGSMIWVQ